MIAKDIIHLILCLQEIINNDPEVNKYLRVVMVENYNVTKAGKLIRHAIFPSRFLLLPKRPAEQEI